jgi:putative Mn2+ efflux pump MntP
MDAGMAMITPLKRARGLGSAHEGPTHFLKQRITGASNAVLFAFAVGLIAALAGTDLATVKATLGHPAVAVALIALIVSMTVHMRIGMHHRGLRARRGRQDAAPSRQHIFRSGDRRPFDLRRPETELRGVV